MHSRHTFLRLSVSAVIAIIGISMSMLTYAASGDTTTTTTTGSASLTVDQVSINKSVIGSWVLLMPNNERASGSGASLLLSNLTPGSYTLIATVPDGMESTVRLYDGSTQINFVERPQLTFQLLDGNNLRVAVYHTLTRVGTVSIQSDPAGLEFTMKGPNGITEAGVTPASFDRYPEGQYTVQYKTLEGCTPLARKSNQLTANSRISFNISLACAAADKIRSRQETKSDKYVVVKVNGIEVQLRDVPQSAWFATYVYNAARQNILAGYKDEAGNPSGDFGPGNNVTIAELAKIAHRIAGVGEGGFNNPENERALNQWFTPFIASAEQRGWTIFQDISIDPARPATRAEVIVTLLQALDVPLQWQTGSVFSDVTVRTRFAAAIETAAADDIIEGRKDEDGKPLNLFAPNDPINRAEIAKIIQVATEAYRSQE